MSLLSNYAMAFVRLNRRSISFAASVGVLMITGWPTSFAESPGAVSIAGPEDVVRQATEQLHAAVDRDRENILNDPEHTSDLVEQIVAPHVDFDRMSRSVLGKRWRQATNAQRHRFKHEFRMLLLRAYGSAVTSHAGADVTFLPTRLGKNAEKATVQIRIPQRTGSTISIDYRLHRKDGRWKVYDVLVEDISIVLTYRSSFAEQVKTFGLEGLIAQLAAKNRQNTDS